MSKTWITASLLAALGLSPAFAETCIIPPSCRISSPYGPRIDPVKKTVGQFHKGLDFACPAMTPVVAGKDGAAEPGFDMNGGNVVRIYTTDNKTLWYMHNTMYKVSNGQFVKAGTVVAMSGNTGAHTTGAHVHLQYGDGVRNIAALKDPKPHLCGKSGEPANPLENPSELPLSSASIPPGGAGNGPEAQMSYPTESDSESIYSQLLSMIGSRVYNPGYVHDISTLSTPKLLAESTYLKSVHLKARQEIRLASERTEALRALILSLEAERNLKRKTQELRANASNPP